MKVKGETKIYRKDFNGRPAYSRSIASQESVDGQKGDWIRAYESVQFPKGANIQDGTTVQVEGFEAVYKTKNGEIKRKLVVQKYQIKNDSAFFGEVADDDMPFYG